MRKSIVWAGIVIVIVGSMFLLIGYVLNYNAWDTLITGVEEGNQSKWLHSYEQQRDAELVVAIGVLMAVIGIGIGFAGMTIEPPPAPMEGYPPPP